MSADGIRIGDDRIKAGTIDLPKSTNIKQLRSVLDVVNFVSKFIPELAATRAPLVAATKIEATLKDNMCWGPQHDRAFARVKQLITDAPVLHFPDHF